MSEEKKPYPSRVNKKNRSATNSILNIMIGLVFALIMIVGAFIFLDQNGGSDNAQEPESVQISTGTDNEASEEDKAEQEVENEEDQIDVEEEAATDDEQTEEESVEESAEKGKDKEAKEEEATEKATEEENADEGTVTGGTITRQESDDPIVKETIINTSWEPIGTSQSGEHVSVYDTNSVDWQEKIDAIVYATGLAEGDMYIMHIGNGGSPQKSVGTVQSKDKSKKYRVHLEWVAKEGWKPVKMDILNSVEGAY